MTNHLDLDTLVLADGKHDSPDKGMCLLEAASYFAHEPWSDHPECVSPVIGAFGRAWNDALDDDARQMLKPYIPKIVGTNTGPEDEERRAWMATDWLIRVQAPAWLRLAGLNDPAAALEGLEPVLDAATAASAQPVLDAARKQAAAAWDAAGAAAGAAARAAAWDAAGAAARAAAWDAARDAAGAAARAAAWDAAGAAARAAARDAAGAAARAAARDAARDALAPTVQTLQQSALELFDRMIAVGAEVPA